MMIGMPAGPAPEPVPETTSGPRRVNRHQRNHGERGGADQRGSKAEQEYRMKKAAEKRARRAARAGHVPPAPTTPTFDWE